IIVHGFRGSPDTNWKPWLKSELEREGISVTVPEMPNPKNPVASDWNTKLAETVGVPDGQTYLVGHSLGCMTILRYLESLAPVKKVGGCIFVAGFGARFPGYDGGHDSFFDHELDWDKIRTHCDNFVAIHSYDDPHVDIAQLTLLGEK